MKIALIPPVPDLEWAATTDLHLLLSHLLDDKRYANHYATRRAAGDYLILDNSAHEFGAGNAIPRLIEQAGRVGAQEVVVPDVLFNARATVQSARRALAWIFGEGHTEFEKAGRPRLMLVPQGDDRAAWTGCLTALVALFDRYNKGTKFNPPLPAPVIGVSKDYDYLRGGLVGLVKTGPLKLYFKRGFDVHCLGWPKDLWTLARLRRAYPWIRSTDSAKPFVYAKHGILLEPGGKSVPVYPRRDDNYFWDALALEQCDTARRNVEVFRAAANDELILPEQS